MGMTNPQKIIGGIILLIIMSQVLAVGVPQLNTNLDNLTGEASGAPFVTFFASNGLVVLVLMAAVVLGVVAYFKIGTSGR